MRGTMGFQIKGMQNGNAKSRGRRSEVREVKTDSQDRV